MAGLDPAIHRKKMDPREIASVKTRFSLLPRG
jgi:hypothetical protein